MLADLCVAMAWFDGRMVAARARARALSNFLGCKSDAKNYVKVRTYMYVGIIIKIERLITAPFVQTEHRTVEPKGARAMWACRAKVRKSKSRSYPEPRTA